MERSFVSISRKHSCRAEQDVFRRRKTISERKEPHCLFSTSSSFNSLQYQSEKNISATAVLCTNIFKISANCQHVWLIKEKQENF